MTEHRMLRAAIEETYTLVLGFRSGVQLGVDLGTEGFAVARYTAKGTKWQWAASAVSQSSLSGSGSV